MLRDSRGVLIWAHQLESLYALFGHPPNACVAFRKDINAKRPEASAVAAGLEVAPGVSLRDVIDERMRFQIVTRPNLCAARYLVTVDGSR